MQVKESILLAMSISAPCYRAGPCQTALYLPLNGVWPAMTVLFSTVPVFLYSGEVLTHDGLQNVPVIVQDHRGGAKAEPMRAWEGVLSRGSRASWEVAEGMEGREQWAITNWWRENFWKMKGSEGYSSRVDAQQETRRRVLIFQKRLEEKWGAPISAWSWEHLSPQRFCSNRQLHSVLS